MLNIILRHVPFVRFISLQKCKVATVSPNLLQPPFTIVLDVSAIVNSLETVAKCRIWRIHHQVVNLRPHFEGRI